VLGVSGHAQRRPSQRDVGQRLTRGSQPALDWTGDVGSRRIGDAPSAPTGSDETTEPLAMTASVPTGQNAPPHLLARRWLVAIGTGVAALAIAGGLFLAPSRQSSKLTASACGARACHQGVTRRFGSNGPPSAGGHQVGARSHPSNSRGAARPSPLPTATSSPTPTTSAPSQTPTPSSTPTSTQSRSPTKGPVDVSYSVVHKWGNGFQGRFTIVNNGSKTVNGWEIAAVLPNDHVLTSWYATYHTNGDTLYLDPTLLQQTIAPGATLTENFTATGTTTTPTSCTFNGSPC
jgi:Cellulose binding domain